MLRPSAVPNAVAGEGREGVEGQQESVDMCRLRRSPIQIRWAQNLWRCRSRVCFARNWPLWSSKPTNWFNPADHPIRWMVEILRGIDIRIPPTLIPYRRNAGNGHPERVRIAPRWPRRTRYRDLAIRRNRFSQFRIKENRSDGVGSAPIAPCLSLIEPDYCTSLTQRNSRVPERS
jgi:hypothetical protein